MANAEHVNRLREGVDAWNEWRRKNPSIRPDFNEADLTGVDLWNADLTGPDLTKADLTRAKLTGADLTKADLREADLTEAKLNEVDLRGADLREAILTGADLTKADLREADLFDVDLTGAKLTRAKLTGAGLWGAILTKAKLTGADLTNADLRGADLLDVDLTKAKLTGAKLTGANLTEADLNDAILRGATLPGPDLTKLDLPKVDLPKVELNNAQPPGPDLIESKLESPLQAAEAHKGGIFISYRREDAGGWVRGLAQTLRSKFGKENVFLDILDMQPGENFPTAIRRRLLESTSVVLAVIGPQWLTIKQDDKRRLDDEEDHLRIEIATALRLNIPVIPVLVGRANFPRPKDLPEDLKALADLNAKEITDTRWELDEGELIAAVERYVQPKKPLSKIQIVSRYFYLMRGYIALITLLSLIFFWYGIYPQGLNEDIVKELQSAICVPVTGELDNSTREGIKILQQSLGSPNPNGIVEPKQIPAIFRSVGLRGPCDSSQYKNFYERSILKNQNDVRELQADLNRWQVGAPIPPTGQLDGQTRQKIRIVRQAIGLEEGAGLGDQVTPTFRIKIRS